MERMSDTDIGKGPGIDEPSADAQSDLLDGTPAVSSVPPVPLAARLEPYVPPEALNGNGNNGNGTNGHNGAPGVLSHAGIELDAPNLDSPYNVDRKPKELIAELWGVINEDPEFVANNDNRVLVRVEKGSKFGDVARFIEATVFKEWYPDKTTAEFVEEMEKDYGIYDDESRFLIILDGNELDEDGLPRLEAHARMVGGKEELIKTLNDVPAIWGISKEEILEDLKKCDKDVCEGKDIGNPETTWDYSSVAVTKDFRDKTDAYAIISHELHKWASEYGILTATSILVEDYWKLYQHFGVPFRLIADADVRVHENEPSVPVVMHLPEDILMSRSERPEVRQAYEFMREGKFFTHSTVTV